MMHKDKKIPSFDYAPGSGRFTLRFASMAAVDGYETTSWCDKTVVEGYKTHKLLIKIKFEKRLFKFQTEAVMFKFHDFFDNLVRDMAFSSISNY